MIHFFNIFIYRGPFTHAPVAPAHIITKTMTTTYNDDDSDDSDESHVSDESDDSFPIHVCNWADTLRSPESGLRTLYRGFRPNFRVNSRNQGIRVVRITGNSRC
jgi:hypothetical protein